MNSRMFIGIVVIAVLSFGGLLFFFSRQPTPRPTQVSLPHPATNNLKPTKTPIPTPISKPVPVETKTLTGTVLSVAPPKLSAKTTTGDQAFTFSKYSEIYKLTGGTLAGGDAKTALVTAADIQAGQEVLIITDKNSNNIQRIVITK